MEMVFSELLQLFLVTESTPAQAGRAISNTMRILDIQCIITLNQNNIYYVFILANTDSCIQGLI
jgi:hypothetical protein